MGEFDYRFNEIDHRFNRLEAMVSDARRETNSVFDGLSGRIDRLHRTIIYVGAMIACSLIFSLGLLVSVTA